jgi:uncharacterized protein (TIGR03083 family)
MTSETHDTDRTHDDAQERISRLVDVWHASCLDLVALLEDLDEADWARPTDLPGWDVKAVAAHLAHLESELAGFPQDQVEVPEAEHVRTMFAQYTEAGPVARRDWPVERIIDELRRAVEARATELRERPPADPSTTGPSFAALAGWSWEVLLTNRPLDIWMHEQDIRRAVARPGGLDTVGAAHAAGVFARSLPMVVGKRAGAAPGQTVVIEVVDRPRDDVPARLAVTVGDDGRARPVDPSADPTTVLRLPFEDWMCRAGGRRAADAVTAEITGDQDLGRRVLEGLAVTP